MKETYYRKKVVLLLQISLGGVARVVRPGITEYARSKPIWPTLGAEATKLQEQQGFLRWTRDTQHFPSFPSRGDEGNHILLCSISVALSSP